MPKITHLNQIQKLIEEAKSCPRLRKNFNLHEETDPIQRFFNALIPGTYVRPHRHMNPAKSETMILIKGNMLVILFDDEGQILQKIELSQTSQNIALDLSPETWHTVYAKEASVYFECKVGPYIPTAPSDFASWAPNENTPEAKTYLKRLMEES